MRKYKIRYVIGVDPSGNFNEGKGTTGWSVYDREVGMFIACGVIRASAHDTQVAYWKKHVQTLNTLIRKFCKQGVVVSVEDYVLYKKRAASQTNSEMETPQLIGVLKYYMTDREVQYFMRHAVIVKERWADPIMVNKNYIRKSGDHYFADCKGLALTEHERDSMRHALHCAHFEIKEETYE